MSNLENHKDLDFTLFNQTNNEVEGVREALQFLDSKRLRVLTQQETDDMASDFASGLINGLVPDPNPTLPRLPMINTRIPIVTFDHLAPDEEALVLVLGGTYVRAAVVGIDESKKPHIKPGMQYYPEKMIRQREFATPSDFYDAMLEPVEAFIAAQKPHAVGIIYAFGGEVVEEDSRLDIQPFETMGKKFAVPGISRTPVGEVVFQRPVMASLKGIARRAVWNDMGLVCVAGEAKIASINATGFNIGLAHNGYYYVTEAGGHFKGMPTHEYTRLIDNKSNNPGHALLEKQLSGGYLGLTLALAFADLRENGHISIQTADDLSSEEVTAIINGQSSLLHGQDEKTRKILLETAARIGYRAAQGMGTLIGSAIRAFPHEFSEENIRVPIVSPLF